MNEPWRRAIHAAIGLAIAAALSLCGPAAGHFQTGSQPVASVRLSK